MWLWELFCDTVVKNKAGALYSWGDTKRYQRIVFERINLPWLTSGYDEPPRVPPSPESVRAGYGPDGRVVLQWAPSRLAEGWYIYRYAEGESGTAKLVADLPADRQEYIERATPIDQTVYYRVEPYNTYGRPPFVPVTRLVPLK